MGELASKPLAEVAVLCNLSACSLQQTSVNLQMFLETYGAVRVVVRFDFYLKPGITIYKWFPKLPVSINVSSYGCWETTTCSRLLQVLGRGRKPLNQAPGKTAKPVEQSRNLPQKTSSVDAPSKPATCHTKASVKNPSLWFPEEPLFITLSSTPNTPKKPQNPQSPKKRKTSKSQHLKIPKPQSPKTPKTPKAQNPKIPTPPNPSKSN